MKRLQEIHETVGMIDLKIAATPRIFRWIKRLKYKKLRKTLVAEGERIQEKNNQLDMLAQKLTEIMNEESHQKRDRFAVQYIVDGKPHGYHASTFCQVTQEIANAKRYTGDPYRQMATIHKNLNFLLDKEGDAVPSDWKGVKKESVTLDYVDVSDLPPQTYRMVVL